MNRTYDLADLTSYLRGAGGDSEAEATLRRVWLSNRTHHLGLPAAAVRDLAEHCTDQTLVELVAVVRPA